MGRRGHSTAIGKIAKIHHDRRVSEIRKLGIALRGEQRAADPPDSPRIEASLTAVLAE